MSTYLIVASCLIVRQNVFAARCFCRYQNWRVAPLIVDSCTVVVRFLFFFGFLIFPSLSDYFPSGELIRTLASEK